MKYLILLLLPLIIACGDEIDHERHFDTVELESIFYLFLEEGIKRSIYLNPKHIKITIVENTLSGATAHYEKSCEEYFDTKTFQIKTNTEIYITIKRKFYEYSNYDSILAVTFHELGHALLNRDHTSFLNENGGIGSLMNPDLPFFIFEDHEMRQHGSYEYYVDEMFSQNY